MLSVSAMAAKYREHSSGAFHWTIFRVPGYTLIPDIDSLWVIPDVAAGAAEGYGRPMLDLACSLARAWTLVTSDRTVILQGEPRFEASATAEIVPQSQVALAKGCPCPGFVTPPSAVRDLDRAEVARAAADCLWLLRAAALDESMRSLLCSFELAHDGRDGFLVKLFEIVETLERRWPLAAGKKSRTNALAAMPGTKPHFDMLGNLANDRPIETSRHAGRHPRLRMMTGDEWATAHDAAVALIRAHATTLLPPP